MRLALVTGGVRRLGAALTRRLADDGWTVAAHHHGPASGPAELPPGARAFRADLADPDAPADLFRAVTHAFGQPPTALVNNAALFDIAEAETPDPRALLRFHAANVIAPVILAHALAAAGGGAVVNILDQRIANPPRDQFGYTLSKMALAEATRLLARTLAPSTRVNAVAPGLTLATTDYAPAQVAAIQADMPLQSLPDPAAIADAVAWLLRAPHVTGQTLFVDGGAHQRSYARDFVHLFQGRV